MTRSSGRRVVLTISTSTRALVVGIGHIDSTGSDLLAQASAMTERQHAEALVPTIMEVLSEASLDRSQLTDIAVDIGPGRFTGLRVGVATAKGLAFGLGLQLTVMHSVEILANGVRPDAAVTAVVDARRGEVFQAIYVNGLAQGEIVVGKPEKLASQARGIVVGDGVDLFAEAYRHHQHLEVRSGVDPAALTMLDLASSRKAVNADSVAPMYLRGPDVNLTPVKVRP